MDQKLGKHEHYRSRLVNDLLFFKIHFLGCNISCDCTELLPATGHVSISFGFTQTEWFRPPHWSRAVVYESINHSTENTICFSLWDREKLVCCCNCFGASLSKKSGREQRRGMKGEVFFLFSLFFYLFCSLSLQLSHKNSIGSSHSLSKNLSQMKRLSRLWYRNCLHHSPSSACASSGGKTNSL